MRHAIKTRGYKNCIILWPAARSDKSSYLFSVQLLSKVHVKQYICPFFYLLFWTLLKLGGVNFLRFCCNCNYEYSRTIMNRIRLSNTRCKYFTISHIFAIVFLGIFYCLIYLQYPLIVSSHLLILKFYFFVQPRFQRYLLDCSTCVSHFHSPIKSSI